MPIALQMRSISASNRCAKVAHSGKRSFFQWDPTSWLHFSSIGYRHYGKSTLSYIFTRPTRDVVFVSFLSTTRAYTTSRVAWLNRPMRRMLESHHSDLRKNTKKHRARTQGPDFFEENKMSGTTEDTEKVTKTEEDDRGCINGGT